MPLKLINKYALPRDQNIFDFTIAIERPLSEFVRNFFDSGKPRVGHPRVAVDADCQALPFPTFFRPGDPSLPAKISLGSGITDEGKSNISVARMYPSLVEMTAAYGKACLLVPDSIITSGLPITLPV